MAPSLVQALDSCSKVSARETNSRFALTRLQLRGDSGSIIGTDSQQLLLWGGFPFPFKDSILVPAIPFFGFLKRTNETQVQLGHTKDHLVFRIGPWIVWLKIDSQGRFPDIARLIHQPSGGAQVDFDEVDTRLLLERLKKGNRTKKELLPISIDWSSSGIIRIQSTDSPPEAICEFTRSSYSGREGSVTLNRVHLIQALQWGFHQMQFREKSPVVFRDSNRT
jgi:hypothetical protein